MIWYSPIESTPLGLVWVGVTARGLAGVRLGGSRGQFIADLVRRIKAAAVEGHNQTDQAVEEIQAYLHGDLKSFTLPLDWSSMTVFQKQVLEETGRVPYGETVTYRELADRIGRPRAARAVGRAEATNPMPLVLPCHRVIASDGSLRGYAGPQGVETKAWLLQLERANL